MSIELPLGYNLLLLDEVDSTNSYASKHVDKMSNATWILAETQHCGRGRQGKEWYSEKGEFTASLVIFPKESLQDLALRSFVMSLALYNSFEKLLGLKNGLSLKWPNDVLLNKGKLAGILLETLPYGDGEIALIIGVGINLISVPPLKALEKDRFPPVSLHGETGVSISPNDFLAVLAKMYDKSEKEFKKYGFEPVRNNWLSKAYNVGENISAKLPNRRIFGVFDTIDEKGHLVLKTREGTVRLATAEIYF